MKKLLIAFLLLFVTITASAEAYTPGHEHCGKTDCFWETPMDVTNESALWAMLTAPMTVVSGDPRTQADIYAEPDQASEIIGEVTCMTQGVHVVEQRDDGWSRIECYSSSFKDSRVGAWNTLVCGWVPTADLTERTVRTQYGLIVDKLDQRLYVFKDGALLDVLAVSTGLADADSPWNETRSGEYVLYSPTGAFPSDPFICNYGIRYNDGDLLHEVPHIVYSNGNRDYGRTEPKLGQRASHGCIRVQRKRTPDGLNMRWLWNELHDQMGTRLVIWEDWPGRQLPIPAADTPVYFNSKGGENYHTGPSCYGVKDRYEPMSAITYGDLSTEDYQQLTACPYCVPPRRTEDIEAINQAHQ